MHYVDRLNFSWVCCSVGQFGFSGAQHGMKSLIQLPLYLVCQEAVVNVVIFCSVNAAKSKTGVCELNFPNPR